MLSGHLEIVSRCVTVLSFLGRSTHLQDNWSEEYETLSRQNHEVEVYKRNLGVDPLAYSLVFFRTVRESRLQTDLVIEVDHSTSSS